MKALKTLISSLGVLTLVSAAQAGAITGQGTWENTLKARDINGNAVALNSASAAFFYDTTLNITWLANMGYDGTRVSWYSAMNWANNLIAGGFSDWRLPTIIDSGTAGCNFSYDGGTDCGYNVQTKSGSTVYSELAHLYYVTLGNLGQCAPGGNTPYTCELQSGWGLSNTAYFQSMQFKYYWSGTEYLSPGSGLAWYFDSVRGEQDVTSVNEVLYVVAVRSGDVLRDAGATVPEPQSLGLALSALVGMVLAVRRRRASSACSQARQRISNDCVAQMGWAAHYEVLWK
jgi:hypothetical protein